MNFPLNETSNEMILSENFLSVNKKHDYVFKTIKEFVDDYYPIIDCQPVGQRLPVESTNKLEKAQGIISSILDGESIGMITLAELTEKEKEETGYDLESVDGGHRKRYMYSYYNNEFSTRGKLFKELSKKEQEKYESTKLIFCVYEPLSVFAKGEIFRNLNKTTDVNFMEKLNSYGNIPIANFIREEVRVVKGIGNSEHRLFEIAEKAPRYLDFENARLIHDNMFARIVYRYTQDEYLGGSNDKDIEAMYNDEKVNIRSLEKKIKSHLDFLCNMAVVRKTLGFGKLTQREFKMLSYVFFYLQDTYKKFTIRDKDEFYKTFKKAFDLLTNANDKYADIKVNLSWEDRAIVVQDAFIKYLNAPQDTKKTQQTMKYLLLEFDIESVITPLDKKRLFSKIEKEQKLSEQDFRCAIDGEPLKYDDAHAAHRNAYIKGNRTIYSNLAMVRIKYNLEMKDMSIEEYMKKREK